MRKILCAMWLMLQDALGVRQHLLQVPLHEDDGVALRGREVVEELGHHLEGLAARARHPRLVLLDFLDLLVFVVALGIVRVGGANVVGDDLQTAVVQHLHHKGSA